MLHCPHFLWLFETCVFSEPVSADLTTLVRYFIHCLSVYIVWCFYSHFHSILGHGTRITKKQRAILITYPHDITVLIFNLDRLTEKCLSGFAADLYFILFGRKSPCRAHTKKQSCAALEGVLHGLSGIFCTDLSILTYLLALLFNHYGPMDIFCTLLFLLCLSDKI